ncbi:nuclear cap binding complex subunit [Rhizophlyctis rosea]|nr:nuclear cap binding complex subunit [Rhizophlyctis rosea]
MEEGGPATAPAVTAKAGSKRKGVPDQEETETERDHTPARSTPRRTRSTTTTEPADISEALNLLVQAQSLDTHELRYRAKPSTLANGVASGSGAEYEDEFAIDREGHFVTVEAEAEGGADYLNAALCKIVRVMRLPDAEMKIRGNLCERLQEIIRSYNKHATIKLYGSWAAGTALSDSDLDVTLYDQLASHPTSQAAKRDALAPYAHLLSAQFPGTLFIRSARVPIIKITDSITGLNVDISYGTKGHFGKSERLDSALRAGTDRAQVLWSSAMGIADPMDAHNNIGFTLKRLPELVEALRAEWTSLTNRKEDERVIRIPSSVLGHRERILAGHRNIEGVAVFDFAGWYEKEMKTVNVGPLMSRVNQINGTRPSPLVFLANHFPFPPPMLHSRTLELHTFQRHFHLHCLLIHMLDRTDGKYVFHAVDRASIGMDEKFMNVLLEARRAVLERAGLKFDEMEFDVEGLVVSRNMQAAVFERDGLARHMQLEAANIVSKMNIPQQPYNSKSRQKSGGPSGGATAQQSTTKSWKRKRDDGVHKEPPTKSRRLNHTLTRNQCDTEAKELLQWVESYKGNGDEKGDFKGKKRALEGNDDVGVDDDTESRKRMRDSDVSSAVGSDAIPVPEQLAKQRLKKSRAKMGTKEDFSGVVVHRTDTDKLSPADVYTSPEVAMEVAVQEEKASSVLSVRESGGVESSEGRRSQRDGETAEDAQSATPQSALDSMSFINGTKLDERIIRTDIDAAATFGRQYGRGRSGGQVRDEHREDDNAGPGRYITEQHAHAVLEQSQQSQQQQQQVEKHVQRHVQSTEDNAGEHAQGSGHTAEGGLGGGGGGYRDLVGKTVTISGGEWKGYVGKVKDVAEALASVELHMAGRIVKVSFTQLNENGRPVVPKEDDRYKRGGFDGGRRYDGVGTPSGAKTPVYAGGTSSGSGTPMYREMDGGTTPYTHHGRRTPGWDTGGRTPRNARKAHDGTGGETVVTHTPIRSVGVGENVGREGLECGGEPGSVFTVMVILAMLFVGLGLWLVFWWWGMRMVGR